MIEIRFAKSKEGSYCFFSSEGHSLDSRGKKGNNLLCAAVSVLVQSLFIYLKEKNRILKFKLDDGWIEFESIEHDTDKSAYEMTITGLKILRDQYDNEINIIELGVK